MNYHEVGEWERCNRGYAERDRRTCPYREEKFGSVIKDTADYTDLTDILEPFLGDSPISAGHKKNLNDKNVLDLRIYPDINRRGESEGVPMRNNP